MPESSVGLGVRVGEEIRREIAGRVCKLPGFDFALRAVTQRVGTTLSAILPPYTALTLSCAAGDTEIAAASAVGNDSVMLDTFSTPKDVIVS